MRPRTTASRTPSWRGRASSSSGCELHGDEVVLDAGCGSGRVTALLADLVPRGRVYAVDVAPSMVRHTRARRSATGPRSPVPGPGRADAARAGRRGLLQRHLPLDPRPRGAVRRAPPHAEARRPAASPSAAGGATSTRSARLADAGRRRGAVRALLRRLAAPVELRDRRPRPPSASRPPGSRTCRCWLEAKLGDPGRRRAAFVHDGVPGPPPRPAARGASRAAVRRPRCCATRRPDGEPARARVRAPEHGRPSGRRSASVRRAHGTAKSSFCPATGSAPRSSPRRSRCSSAVGAEFEYEEHLFGGASIDAHGTALTDETLAACKRADAVLLAAVGGPKWDTTDPTKPRPEQGLLGLRKGLGLFANLRPVGRCRRCTTPARSSAR